MVFMRAILVLAGTFALSECIFEIDELRRMVSSMDDNWHLKLLGKERDTPRDEIQAKVNTIVHNQPVDVQQVYRELLASEGAKEEAEFKVDLIVLEARGASESLIEAMHQIRNITLDMALSPREEKRQIKAIKRAMSREDRETLDSSSEED